MSHTVKLPTCPKCGLPIPQEAPQGLCPKCVLLVAATATLKMHFAPVYALIGYLVGVNLPSQVELRCPTR